MDARILRLHKERVIMKRITRIFALLLAVTLGGLAYAEPIDINTADSESLAAGLNGVGQAKAQAIVAYREANGPFGSTEELTRVKGIGTRILDLNRNNIRVGSDRR